MRAAKIWLKRIGLALLIAVFCVVGYCEIHFRVDEIVTLSEDTEWILRQTPEAEITEKDRELVEALSQCSAVQALLEGTENGDLRAPENPELADTAGVYLNSEEAGTLRVEVLMQEDWSELLVSWNRDEKEMFLVQRSGDEYYKLYARDGWTGRRTVYENHDNEQAQKITVRRRWLAYFRDRMWEES